MGQPRSYLAAIQNWSLPRLGPQGAPDVEPLAQSGSDPALDFVSELVVTSSPSDLLVQWGFGDENDRSRRQSSLVCVGLVALDREISSPRDATLTEQKLAAALSRAAHPGQVLLTVDGAGPPLLSLPLAELGRHVLDLDLPPVDVWQVGNTGEGQVFPPINSVHPVRHNLESRRDPFFGRFHELEQLRDLVRQRRLINLWGEPGIGKSSLAWRLAIELAAEYPKGAWTLKLHRESSHETMHSDLAALLGFSSGRLDGSSSTIELGDRALLVLDGCDECQDSAQIALESIAVQLPEVLAIATSRAPLAVAGMVPFQVGPLQIPPSICGLGPHELLDFDAARLIIDRLERNDPSWRLDSVHCDEIAEICRLFCGNPAALLACTQTYLTRGMADVRKMVRPLGSAFPSVDEAQEIFLDAERLPLSKSATSVLGSAGAFVGDWTLHALAAVAPEMPADTFHSSVSELIDANLIEVRLSHESEMRLAVNSSLAVSWRVDGLPMTPSNDVIRRHSEYFLDLVEANANNVAGKFLPIRRNLDNIRLAISRSFLDESGAEIGLRFVVGMALYWISRGQTREGLAIAQRACLRAKGEAHANLARANNILGTLLMYSTQYREAIEVLNEVLEVTEATGDHFVHGMAHGNLASCFRNLGDLERALAHGIRSAEALEPLGRDRRWAGAVSNVGTIYEEMRNFKQAEIAFRRAADRLRELGETWSVVRTEYNLGEMARNQGDFPTAIERHRGNLAESVETDDAEISALNMEGIAFCLLALGREAPIAATLLGIATNLRSERGCPPGQNQRGRIEALSSWLKESLGEDRFNGLLATSRSLTVFDASTLLKKL